MKKTLIAGLSFAGVMLCSTAAIAQQAADECEQLVNFPTPGPSTSTTPSTATDTAGAKPADNGTGSGKATGGNTPVPVTGSNAKVGDQPVVVKNPNVNVGGLKDPMKNAMDEIYRTARELGLPVPIITSAKDSKHSDGSLHYQGLAVDLRCNSLYAPGSKCAAWEKSLQRALGSNYDVIFETFPDNPMNNHIHVEYDPRG